LKFYLVVFDRPQLGRYQEFHKAFTAHPKFRRWWHYIKSAYIIGGNVTASEISDHFTTCARKLGFPTTHLVIRADLRYRQGMLIKDAWEWIRLARAQQSEDG